MKVGILAGGVGSRFSEETEIRPKPMIEIGSKPILWHIMKFYASYGFKDFVIALGYKGNYIKKYMIEYCANGGDVSIDFSRGHVTNGCSRIEDWKLDLVDTGLHTATGGRMKRLAPYLGSGTTMVTYGDGLSDVNLTELLAFHRAHGKLATVTAVRPPERFGKLTLDGDRVTKFTEKPQMEEGWINGAFFVLEPAAFDYIEGDDTSWEYEPLEELARSGQLMAYKHRSFWQCMDTLRDKKLLEKYWGSGRAPWKTW